MNQMTMAGMAAMAGGPVGGGMPLMNNGTGPQRTEGDKHEDFRNQLNTYIYDYFLKSGYHDCARALVHNDIPLKTKGPSKTSPGHRDGDVNGLDDNSMDTDSKDEAALKLPEDLPRPDVPPETTPTNSFLFDWFCLFTDIFRAQRKIGKPDSVAAQYLHHTQGMQRMRAEHQKAMLQQPGMVGQMNQFGIPRGMPNGMMAGDLQKRALQNNARNLTPQQLAQLQNQKMLQMQRENSDMEMNGHRPQSPSSAENAPSPSKRPRLEGGQFSGQQMPPNGRGQPQGMPGPNANGQSAQLLLANGINPGNLTPTQFQSFQSQNPSVQQKSIQVYAQNLAQHHSRSAMNNQAMPKGMMNPGVMPNQGSPMMQPLPDGQMGMPTMSEYYAGNPTGMPMGRMQPPGGQGGNHALQDYQMQLMLLEQQNKKRLMMARQEQDSMTRADGQPVMAAQQPLAPGMSPSGSRAGPSPNPSDQMKRGTPKMNAAGLPGSPNPGDAMVGARGSPAAMNFGGMGPNGAPNMRPPSSNPQFNGQMNAPMDAMMRAQQGGNRMPSGNWQQGPQGQGGMIQQPPQGQPPQTMGTPQERNAMPPPQAPPAGGANNTRTQPSSPQQNPSATPTQTNKANPKKKGGDKEATRKRPNKKTPSAPANEPTPSGDAEPPPTPTPSTPVTAQHPGAFTNKQGPNAGASGAPPTSAPVPQGPPPPQQPDPAQVSFSDMSMTTDNFNLDFSNIDAGDVLENFDFDTFLNTDDPTAFPFDPSLSFAADGVEASGDV